MTVGRAAYVELSHQLDRYPLMNSIVNDFREFWEKFVFEKYQHDGKRLALWFFLVVFAMPLFMVSLLIVPRGAIAAPVDFTLPDINGKPRKLSEFRGKWVVVNYWATWCPPCLAEIPDLVAFYDKHKNKDAVVVGVNFEDIDPSELKQFAESYFMSYPILRQKPAPKSALGLILGLPTSFLVSPKGEVIAKQTGPVTGKMIEDFIKEQTASSAKTSAGQKTAAVGK